MKIKQLDPPVMHRKSGSHVPFTRVALPVSPPPTEIDGNYGYAFLAFIELKLMTILVYFHTKINVIKKINDSLIDNGHRSLVILFQMS